MSKRHVSVLLKDMIEACDRIASYVEGFDFPAFERDNRTTDAVCRCLEIIGEAARNMPQLVRDQNAGIPWQAIVGIRNRIIHEYFSVDIDVLWAVATEEVPALYDQLFLLLNALESKPA